ncbi:hypothetical protein Ato02nite_014700 [Paractinoplanes toevensis]|uniref:Uncharacterized protein n=2 Tax=Paractinoplanes toevensis TaxID=571911 RepID=A0A919T6N1_9ACTN|nr:hypothetical protein Ato02nite_014700 [Actinoplanes toevensis]
MASPPLLASPRVRFEPVWFHQTLLDGSWCPESADPSVELPVMLPILQEARGPVSRLLLSAAGWSARPHQVVVGGRTISVGYCSDLSPSLMIVRCAGGDSFSLRVAPGPIPAQRAGS